MDRISEEIDSLLQWLSKLKKLIAAGRHAVLRIKRLNNTRRSLPEDQQQSHNRSVDSELTLELLYPGPHVEEQFTCKSLPVLAFH